jgi:hypothetical protein
MQNDPKATDSKSLRTAVARQTAHFVKKAWCAYYDPDRVAFGKPSRCVGCCVNFSTGMYDPELLDLECKRSNIVLDCLPSKNEAAKKRGF